MALQLAPEEPEAAPWRAELLSTIADAVTRRRPDRGSSGRPAVLAVDGRSNNGKTTVAARIGTLVQGAVVIHTDDIAFEHSRFGWADLLIDGILVPAHQGRAVRYRPPKWDEHGREGSLDVPAGCPLLIIEGDGAGRREVAHLIDTLIWVQADDREAAPRSAARVANPPAADLVNKAVDGTPFDQEGWMAEEIPFNAAQRTWERADIIVCGTPEIPTTPAPKSSSHCNHAGWFASVADIQPCNTEVVDVCGRRGGVAVLLGCSVNGQLHICANHDYGPHAALTAQRRGARCV